jgi:hypothetical protein
MRRFIAYLRYYNEPDVKDVRQRASDSYHEHVVANPRWFGDLSFCSGYKSAYERAYRHSYARAKVEQLGRFYN